MVHLGARRADRRDVVDRAVTLGRVDQPQLAAVRLARRGAAAGRHARRGAARRDDRGAGRDAGGGARDRRASTCWTRRIVGAPGVHAYDPLRLAIDVRGTGASGYELSRELRERHQVFTELAGENVIVGVFGMAEDAAPQGRRLVAALARRRRVAGRARRPHARGVRAAAAVGRAGDVAPRRLPRRAGGGARSRDAVGRIAAESLAAYPPGIPNVLPGERLTPGDARLHPHHARPRRQPARRQRPGAQDREGGGGDVIEDETSHAARGAVRPARELRVAAHQRDLQGRAGQRRQAHARRRARGPRRDGRPLRGRGRDDAHAAGRRPPARTRCSAATRASGAPPGRS